MWCNQIFSLIHQKTIQNIIVCDNYEIANQIARIQYGEDAFAVDTTHYPLGVGYKCIDGRFYEEDGATEILRNLTFDEEANLALNKVNAVESRQVEIELDVDYRLSKLELGLA